MIKNINKTISRKKIIIIALLSPVALLALFIAYYFISKPIYDNFDHDKFTTLDTQMQGLYKEINLASDGQDDWKYAAVCNDIYSGDWPTGSYNCATSISVKKTISTVDELNNLHNKYFSIIDNNDRLKPIAGSIESSGGFGQTLSVSLTYKGFSEKKSQIECEYRSQLNQNEEKIDYNTNNHLLGSEIINNNGEFFISLRCHATARNPWYPLSKTADLIIP